MIDPADEAECLAEGAAAVGVALHVDAAAGLLRFLDLLYAWNVTAGLTTVQRQDAVRVHLVDSLAAVNYLTDGKHLIDIGSGAGLPGIPVAVALPQWRVSLVESNRRRCSFLREVIRELGLGRCRVVEANARRLVSRGEWCDTAIGRAVAPVPAFFELAAPLVRTGGRVVVMAGRWENALVTQAITASGESLRRVQLAQFRLPGGGEERQIAVYQVTR